MLVYMEFGALTMVAIMANVLGAAMALPQTRKLLSTRSVEGVSITWAAASATVNACWIVYGFGVGDLGIVPVSIVSVIAYIIIGVGIYRFSPTSGRHVVVPAIVTGVVVMTVPLIALLVGGWVAAGLALGVLYGVQLLPAVVTVYRTVDVSGVSLATWVIAVVEAVLWGFYGLANVDAGLIALAVTGTMMSSLVLARLLLRRSRRASHDEPLGLPGLVTA